MLLMMVVGCVVDDWQVVQQWWGGWVWMVVVLGFGFVQGGEREKERERKKLMRGERGFWVIYFIV